MSTKKYVFCANFDYNNGLIQRYQLLFVMEPKLVGNNAVAAIK
jgi:hypothetical protein